MSDSGSDPVPIAAADGGGRSATFVSSRLMIAAIAFFFAAVVFVALLDLYARLVWGRSNFANPRRQSRRRSRRHLRFLADGDGPTAPRHGLPAEVLKALPIQIYKSWDSEEAVECAVCLSELVDGEKVRVLPPCKHCFHVECIDMWFHSHSTCPLCRNPVAGTETVVLAPAVPATYVIPGNDNTPRESIENGTIAPLASASAASSNGRALVIEIPRRVLDAFTSPVNSPLPSSRRAEERKSPAATPPTSRLRSLRRIASKEKKAVAVSSCSSPCGDDGDLEAGVIRPPPPAAAGTGTSVGGSKTPHVKI